nr:3988_t:CDS:1 [Entrophospora candida]
MTNLLPSDCIHAVISFLSDNDKASLHSCLLINKLWCLTIVEKLWSKPFLLTRLDRSAKLVETYLSCINQEELSVKEGKFFKKYNKHFFKKKSATFNYPKYLRSLNYLDIYNSVEHWSNGRFSVDDWLLVTNVLCKLFMNRSSAFLNLSIETGQMIPLAPIFCRKVNNNSPFSLIREFCCYGKFQKDNIYKEMAKTCRRIEVLIVEGPDIDYANNSDQEEIKELIALITNQKALRKLEFHNFNVYDNSIVSALGKHSQTLTYLVFHYAMFMSDKMDELEGITDLENLQHLAFNACENVDEELLEQLHVKQLPKLTELDFRHTRPPPSSMNILIDKYGQMLKKLYLGALQCDHTQTDSCLQVVRNITEKCSNNLEEFSITFTNPLLDCFLRLLESCTRLKKLSITGSFEYTDDSLSLIGASIPVSLKSLIISTKWSSELENLERFFAKCEAGLEYLFIEKLPCISDKHINVVMKRQGNTLKTLKILASEINISDGVMKRAKKKVEVVNIRTDSTLLYEDFDILSNRELTGIPWKENWYEFVDVPDDEIFFDYSDDDYDYHYGDEYDYGYDDEYDYDYDNIIDEIIDDDEFYDDFVLK